MKLSKALSFLLRHNFEKEGLKAEPGIIINSVVVVVVIVIVVLLLLLLLLCYCCCLFVGGYLYLDDVMSLPKFTRYSLDKVKQVVASNDKQRYSIRSDPITGRLQIRANQGHSIKVNNIYTRIVDGEIINLLAIF